MGVSLRGLSQQDGTVTVEFDDGSAGRYDLVIGADGIHSTVRQLTVGADAVRPVGQVAWRFVTECPPEVTTWTVLLGRGIIFLGVPIGRSQVYCYCDGPASSTPRPDGDVTGRLAELLTGFAAPVPALLDTLGPAGAVHLSPIEEVTLDRWSRGSVLLIGTLRTRRHPIWPKAPRWPSRTAWSSPSALPPGAASPRRWRPSRLGAAHARNGSLTRRTTGTAPATCHPLCATWCCADGDATSSTPTTNHFSNSPDGASLRCRGTAETTRTRKLCHVGGRPVAGQPWASAAGRPTVLTSEYPAARA